MTATTAARRPWFEVVSGALGLALAGVVALAVVRHVTAPGLPVLPLSWCRPAEMMPTRPLLGSALLTAWGVDPIALVVLAVAGALYGGGVAALRRHGQGWPLWRSVSFAAGLAVCALATNSSIAVYDMALFSAHMIGHLMLVMLGPILLCAAQPLTLLADASAEPWSGRVRRLLRSGPVSVLLAPPVALASYAAVIVGSHLTGLMDLIMQRPWAGQLEHLVYVVVGCQFFTLVVGNEPIRWRLTTPGRWVLLALSMAVDTFTGVVLLMSVQPIAMMAGPGLNVDTLADTRTGGAIMWVGGDGLMALVMIVLGRRWLRSAELRRTDRRGWVEQTRQSVFAGRVSGALEAEVADDFDDAEARRLEYNRWLGGLEHGRSSGTEPDRSTTTPS